MPRQLWTLPWAQERYPDELQQIRVHFPDDITGSPSFLREPFVTEGDQYAVGTYIDEWGCVFENLQRGVIGEVKDVLIKSWDDISKIQTPLASLSVDVEQVNAFCKATNKFVMGACCPRPFERTQFLRGSQQLYLDLAEQREELFTLINQVHQFYVKELELWASTSVDGLMFMDDWGSQRNLLIAPRQWRKIFKPLYQEYIEIAHAHGKKAFMHSDGYTAAIIPDLIELELDALNTQIFTMDIKTLGEQFGGKITFWGEIDRQWLLPHATTSEIDAAVHEVAKAFWRKGGAIAQCEFGPGGKPENVRQMFETWEALL